MRTADEIAEYRAMLARHPDVIDLVDRTSVQELTALMDRFSVVITVDSSPSISRWPAVCPSWRSTSAKRRSGWRPRSKPNSMRR
jgi:hypothetical protein